MLVKLGEQLCRAHEKLKLGKDKLLIPLVKTLPHSVSANQITLFRLIVFLIWLPFAIFKPAPIQIVIFFIVGFLDLYDGAVARFKNQVSYFGKYFDTITDRINRIPLFFVLLAVFDYQIITFKFFIIWDLFTALFLIVEYFLRNEKVIYIRTLTQFCARFSLWIVLIYEVVRVYGLV